MNNTGNCSAAQHTIINLNDDNCIYVPQELIYTFERVFAGVKEAQQKMAQVADAVKPVEHE